MTVDIETYVAPAVEQGKREILADVIAKRVPANIASFGDLHDYVDANEYGGLCNDDAPWNADDFDRDLWYAIGNDVQDALDAWIKTGAVAAAAAIPHAE